MAICNSDDRALPSRPSPNSSGQLPALTSLRGIAAMWVVLYHYSAQCFPNLDTTEYTHLIHKGYLAVDLFFMLSGFVMTHVYHRAFSETVTQQHYWRFIVARIARVYPLHILVLLLFVVTAVTFHLAGGVSPNRLDEIPMRGPESVSAFVANVFMLQGLDAGQLSWNYPAWSISVEFVAYLVFPFALAAIWDLSSRAKAGIALCLLAALVALAALSKGNFDQWDGPITLLRCLPEFIFGTLLYCAFRASSPHPWFAGDFAAVVVIAAVIVCLHADAPDLLITSLFGAFVLIAVLNTGTFAGWAKAPALIWLGDVSYSLYLLHGFLQFLAGKLLAHFGVHNHADLSVGSSFMLMAAMIGLCLLAAHFTYFGIEIGCRQHLREMLDAQIKKRRAKINKSASSACGISAPAWARSVTFKSKT
jgi:peptidoglycan/LPS O-acetylase OafA/YrhL